MAKSVNRIDLEAAGKKGIWAGSRQTQARQPCVYVDVKDCLSFLGLLSRMLHAGIRRFECK